MPKQESRRFLRDTTYDAWQDEELPAVDENGPSFLSPDILIGDSPKLGRASSMRTPELSRQLSTSRTGHQQLMKLAQVRG